MRNKLDKEYLLELYETYNEDNMLYALTILKSLGLNEWFKTKTKNFFGKDTFGKECKLLENNLHLSCLFNFSKLYMWEQVNIIIQYPKTIECFDVADFPDAHIEEIIYYLPELKKYINDKQNEINTKTF